VLGSECARASNVCGLVIFGKHNGPTVARARPNTTPKFDTAQAFNVTIDAPFRQAPSERLVGIVLNRPSVLSTEKLCGVRRE
jgi:hypothetical protein